MIKFLGIFILAAFSTFCQTDNLKKNHEPFFHNKISLSFSVNVNNSINTSQAGDEVNYEALPSFGVGIEYYFTKNENGSSTGIGAEYQFKNFIPEVSGSYKNLPVYLFYDISLSQYYLSIPQLSLKLGYNFLLPSKNFLSANPESKNGIYYALGISSQLNKHFMIRIMYSVNQGKINFNNKQSILKNEKINIGFYFLF